MNKEHKHTFEELMQCVSDSEGNLDMRKLQNHTVNCYNGGQKCDVTTGPCSCGAWHHEYPHGHK